MDIVYFQGIRPFRLEPPWTSFTSKGYGPLGWRGEPSWTSFTSKGYDPLGWGGTIMDIFYFQGVRPFRLRGGTIMDILYCVICKMDDCATGWTFSKIWYAWIHQFQPRHCPHVAQRLSHRHVPNGTVESHFSPSQRYSVQVLRLPRKLKRRPM